MVKKSPNGAEYNSQGHRPWKRWTQNVKPQRGVIHWM
jgi:hypothetical protein